MLYLVSQKCALTNFSPLAYNTWCPNYSTTSPLPVEPHFPILSTYLSNNPSQLFSSSWLLLLSLSDLTGYFDQGVLLKSTADISQMTRSRFSDLHNGYLTTLIMWHNLCISPKNKPNSNIVIFIKTLYVTFICTPHYNTLSDTQGYRILGVEHQPQFTRFSWLCWASAKLIVKFAQNKISPASKPGKTIVECIIKYQTVLIKFWHWYLYDWSTMNR